MATQLAENNGWSLGWSLGRAKAPPNASSRHYYDDALGLVRALLKVPTRLPNAALRKKQKAAAYTYLVKLGKLECGDSFEVQFQSQSEAWAIYAIQVNWNQLSRLRLLADAEDWSDVQHFLSAQPDAFSQIQETIKAIRHVFCTNKLVLNVVIDPDAGEAVHVSIQVIVPCAEAEEASTLMNQFDESFWFANCRRLRLVNVRLGYE